MLIVFLIAFHTVSLKKPCMPPWQSMDDILHIFGNPMLSDGTAWFTDDIPLDVMECMIMCGANVHLGHHGWSPIHWVANKGPNWPRPLSSGGAGHFLEECDKLALLIRHRANLDLRTDDTRERPIDIAR